MKIPTNLKHKPVIVSENYGNVDGRRAYASDAQDWPNGTTGAGWIFPPRSGDTRGKNGPASRRSCPCIGCWIWRF